jgi:predicted DNA-binding protein (UPF0251 family)
VHFEILVEDASGATLLEILTPKLLGTGHTWRIHPYKGAGRIPKDLKPNTDAKKRILLDQLPRLLRGFRKNTGIDRIVVIVDADNRDCVAFLGELNKLAQECGVDGMTMFRLAIEEMEAWYLGDRTAILQAYPNAKMAILNSYVQDSICGTWERLADAIVRGGSAAVKREGWTRAGELKSEWARVMGPVLDLEGNLSPSFKKFCTGLRRLAEEGHDEVAAI